MDDLPPPPNTEGQERRAGRERVPARPQFGKDHRQEGRGLWGREPRSRVQRGREEGLLNGPPQVRGPGRGLRSLSSFKVHLGEGR